jgi:hypothetical protein
VIAAVVLNIHGALPGRSPDVVMPGLVPGIHVLALLRKRQGVDGRDKPGHDGWASIYSRHCHGKLRQIKPEQIGCSR